MIGGISVSVTTGLGAAIVTTAYGDNQVRNKISYAVKPAKSMVPVQLLVYILLDCVRRSHSP